VIGSAGERILRLTPPLTLSLDEASLALTLLEGALA
jgi:4-aminobutyrate aminotransferase-like enzyme